MKIIFSKILIFKYISKIIKIIILIESHFLWDNNMQTGRVPVYSTVLHGYITDYRTAYRIGNYLPLETIDDLVDQFNYVGFNDLCIYPDLNLNADEPDYEPEDLGDLAFYNDPTRPETKGIEAVYYGHTNRNQTGK